MKKIILIGTTIGFCMIVVVSVSLLQNQKNISQMKQSNAKYESFNQKELFGTQVATLINQAINENYKNEVEVDEKGFFINNGRNSLHMEIKLLYEEELKSYPMETIEKMGTQRFVENFNLIVFRCSSIEYHKQTGRVSKMVFEQIES